MSNPGVITLASLNDNSFVNFPYRFVVEDNIGEAIHIHYKNIRLDLTIREFLELAEKVKMIFKELVSIPGFKLEEFDLVHLLAFSSQLCNIERIETGRLKLSDILVDTYSEDGEEIIAHLKDSRVFKALNGCEKEDNLREQVNYFMPAETSTCTNRERLKICLEKIKEQGYPFDGQFILLNKDNVIVDGQHRAACLYYLYGDIEVEVHRFFENASSDRKKIEIIEDIENDTCENEKQNSNFKLQGIKRLIKKFWWRTWHSDEQGEKVILERIDEGNFQMKQLEKQLYEVKEEMQNIKQLEQIQEQIQAQLNKILYR